MGTVLVNKPISIQDLREIGEDLFGDMVKAVVDIEKEVMVVGAELHSDEGHFCSNETLAKRIYGASTCIPTAHCLKWWSSIP
jgi:hypothetical protein